LTERPALGTLRDMGVRLSIRSGEHGLLPEELHYDFDQERIAIGRGPGADVRIPHLSISDAHATVRAEQGGYAIVDHGSTNGTRVNGVALSAQRKKKLADGDVIEIGAYALRFQSAVMSARPTTAERTAELARRLFRRSRAGERLPGPHLAVLTGPQTGHALSIPGPPSRLLIGTAQSCQLVLPDAALRAEHAEVVRDLDGVLIRALEPSSPLTINGRSVVERRMRDNDELVLGETRLLFEEPAEESMDALTGEPDVALLGPSLSPTDRAGADTASYEPASAPASGELPQAPQARNAQRGFDADLLVYALALVMIAASVAGLLALLRAE
jgi:predicted component of type VI protein secretion system